MDRKLCESFRDRHVVFADSRVWQCCLWELCYKFVKINREIDYSTLSVCSMTDVVGSVIDSGLCSVVDEMTQTHQERLYYVPGWTLSAPEKMARRRKKEFADVIMDSVHHCIFELDYKALEHGLPIGKVGRIEAIGSLNYVIISYL